MAFANRNGPLIFNIPKFDSSAAGAGCYRFTVGRPRNAAEPVLSLQHVADLERFEIPDAYDLIARSRRNCLSVRRVRNRIYSVIMPA